MPIYIKYEGFGTGIGGESPARRSGGTNGGVWKTTNFLTAQPGVVRVSRMSLVNGGDSVDGRETMPTRKVADLFSKASRIGPSGKLLVATDSGVFSKIDPMGRLRVGTEGGIWFVPAVQIFVSDAGSTSGRTFRLRNVTILPSRGEQLTLNFTKVEF